MPGEVERIAKGLTSEQRWAVLHLPADCGSYPYRHGIAWGTPKALAARGLGVAYQIDRFFVPNELFPHVRDYLKDHPNGK